jgi:hypothetical protein
VRGMDDGLKKIRKDFLVFCYHMVKKLAAQLYVYYVSDSIIVSIATKFSIFGKI